MRRKTAVCRNSTEKIIHQRTNTVPFALASPDDDVTATVRVIRPLEASDLDLETTYQNFHPSAQSLSSVIGHFLSGERPKGIHETEEMLRVGESVTAVGELVLDNHVLKLQPPKQGFCYFLSRLDYDGLLRRQSGSLRVWWLLSLLLGGVACSTLLYVLWRRYERRRRRRKERRLLEEFARQQKERLHQLKVDECCLSPSVCSICLSRQRSCVFLECGHVCACAQCCDDLPAPKTCPICRAAIARVVTLYNS